MMSLLYLKQQKNKKARVFFLFLFLTKFFCYTFFYLFSVYQPLQLMHAVILRINDICLRFLDNSQLDQILAPTPVIYKAPRYAVCAVKNTRRKMEDRHTCIDDFNAVFGIEETERTSYYAVFDGHAGQDAAYYSVAHLHQNIASSPNYPTKPIEAIRDAFHKTDLAFLEKCKREVNFFFILNFMKKNFNLFLVLEFN